MNIKKLLACLLALVMVLSLVACGGDAGTTDDVDTDPQPTEDVDQQPDAGDEQTSPEGQSLMEILKDRFVAVPDLAGTTWTFIGGYMQGVQLTEENTADILSQMDDLYQFEFIDDTTAVLTEGTRASDCVKCGRCENTCPQHLPIRQLLMDVAETFEKPSEA